MFTNHTVSKHSNLIISRFILIVNTFEAAFCGCGRDVLLVWCRGEKKEQRPALCSFFCSFALQRCKDGSDPFPERNIGTAVRRRQTEVPPTKNTAFFA